MPLVLAVLAGLLVIGVAVERGRAVMDERARRQYERGSHARLLRELHRHD